jgi:hypothetical protein
MYQGDFTTSNTLYVYFNTFDSNDPSASVTLTGLAVTDIEIYKDGSVTQRSSDAGYTLLDTDGIDFDGTTGIHGFSVDLSDNTDAGFYAAGSEYVVVVASVTVDAGTVNFVAATFSIERAGGALALLKGTNSLANIEDKIDIIDTNVDQIETAVITNAAGTDIAADIIAMKAETVLILADTAEIGPAGLGLTNVKLPEDGLDLILKTSTHSLAVADAVWDELLTGAQHNDTNSAGRLLRQVDAAFIITEGTAQAGAAGTITLAAGESATNDLYRGDRVQIIAGTGLGEHGIITAYAGGTKVATMSENWVVQPDNTSEYILVPADADVETWQHTTVTGDGDWAQLQTDATAILVDTGTTIPGLLPAALVGGLMSSNVTAISTSTAAADNLEASAKVIVVGAAEAGTLSTTEMTSDLSEVTNDHYIGRTIIWTSGVLLYQATDITDYVGTGGHLTYSPVTDIPGAGDTFVIV